MDIEDCHGICCASLMGLRFQGQAVARSPNVTAIGIGRRWQNGRPTLERTITVCLEKQDPAHPAEVEGIEVQTVTTGRFKIPGLLSPRPARLRRPVVGGISIGHKDVTAGTMGCLVEIGGEVRILSNNHVLANADRSLPGDAILQPGAYDGGVIPTHVVAALDRAVPIGIDPTPDIRGDEPLNLVDAAVAEPVRPGLVAPVIEKVGHLYGVNDSPELGTRVRKMGRTTGLTEGLLEMSHVTVEVWYDTRAALFEQQLLFASTKRLRRFSEGGDSGSVIVDSSRKAVALLFAGSWGATIGNRFPDVLEALDARLVTRMDAIEGLDGLADPRGPKRIPALPAPAATKPAARRPAPASP